LTPAELKSRFFADLLAHNQPQLAGWRRWVFLPGMRFRGLRQWWGAEKPRPAPHEGIDLCSFEDTGGNIVRVDGNLKIPATFAGAIVKIAADFLGQSIFLSHEIYSDSGRQLFTIYGHTEPRAALAAGQAVAEGEIIAEIAASAGDKNIPLHLHLTFAWVPLPLPAAQLSWEMLSADPSITLLDPLLIL
jgi:hypothetical protein